MGSKEIKRFALVYAGLALVVLAAGYGAYKGYTQPAAVHQAQLKAATADVAGDQDLTAQCEANITSTLIQNKGQLTHPYKLVSVRPKGSKAEVRVRVSSDLYTGDLVCSFSKSNWNLDGVKPAP